MLFIVLLFGAFLAFLALAPQEVVRAALVLMWVAMAAGCAASVAGSIVGRL